jgi:hypothetical protein
MPTGSDETQTEPGGVLNGTTPGIGSAANGTDPGLGALAPPGVTAQVPDEQPSAPALPPPSRVSTKSKLRAAPVSLDISTDSLLEGLGGGQKASDGNLAVAFAVGPRPVPQAHTNPNDEPAVVLRQSIVDADELEDVTAEHKNALVQQPVRAGGLSLERVGKEQHSSPRRHMTPVTQPLGLEAPKGPNPFVSPGAAVTLRRSNDSGATMIRDFPKRENSMTPWLWLGALVLAIALAVLGLKVYRPDILSPARRVAAQPPPSQAPAAIPGPVVAQASAALPVDPVVVQAPAVAVAAAPRPTTPKAAAVKAATLPKQPNSGPEPTIPKDYYILKPVPAPPQ